MKNMVGLELADIEVVTEDGSPSGQKHFLIWNSPFKDPMAPSLGRHSSLSEATGLMRFLMKRGIRVILFCKVNGRFHAFCDDGYLRNTRFGRSANW